MPVQTLNVGATHIVISYYDSDLFEWDRGRLCIFNTTSFSCWYDAIQQIQPVSDSVTHTNSFMQIYLLDQVITRVCCTIVQHATIVG